MLISIIRCTDAMTTYPRLCIGSFQKEFKIRYKTIVLV